MGLSRIIFFQLCVLPFVVNSQRDDGCGVSLFTRKRCSGRKVIADREDCLAEKCCWDTTSDIPLTGRCYQKGNTEWGGLLDFSATPATATGILSVGGSPGHPGSEIMLKCNLYRLCPTNSFYDDNRSECTRRGCCWKSGICYQQTIHILKLRSKCPPGFKGPPACKVPHECVFDDLASAPAMERKFTPTDSPMKKKNYVAFVVDDTGSMGGEISAVKLWLTNCANGVYPDCLVPPTGGWILSPFNDPGVGPKVGPTTTLPQILTAISGLTANGGGDCPELAMQGILDALTDVPIVNSGCKIFFFSDATAKDSALLSQVTTQVMLKGCTFTPVLSGCCGSCQDPCLTLPSAYCASNVVDGRPIYNGTKKGGKAEPRKTLVKPTPGKPTRGKPSSGGELSFYDLAHKSGGKIILTGKRSSTEYVGLYETAMKIVSCATDKIAGPLPNGFTEERCRSTKSCWDGTKLKCFCQSAINCPKC